MVIFVRIFHDWMTSKKTSAINKVKVTLRTVVLNYNVIKSSSDGRCPQLDKAIMAYIIW